MGHKGHPESLNVVPYKAIKRKKSSSNVGVDAQSPAKRQGMLNRRIPVIKNKTPKPYKPSKSSLIVLRDEVGIMMDHVCQIRWNFLKVTRSHPKNASGHSERSQRGKVLKPTNRIIQHAPY